MTNKSNFKVFALIWVILFAIFNLASFLTPGANPDVSKFDANFWTGYCFITLAFILHIGVAYFAFKANNNQKLFYNISLIKASYTGLIFMLIFSVITMAVPAIPNFIGILLCFAIVAFSIIAVSKASLSAEIVDNIDQKVKTQTFFIKSLSVDANTLLASAQSDEAKGLCNQLFEAIRYSDPMSNDALSGVESQISIRFNDAKQAVANNDTEVLSNVVKELLILIQDRNNKCRLLK